MIFLSNTNKIDYLKTVKENNLSENNNILIMASEYEKSEQSKQSQKEEQKNTNLMSKNKIKKNN